MPAQSAPIDGRRSVSQPPPVPVPVASLLGAIEWQGVYDKVTDLLDINVADVMLGGWKKCAEVRRQVRASRADPSRTVLVHLGSHTITSEHRPSIEIRHDGRALADIVFPMALKFEVDAVELTLKGGEVTEVRTGDVRMKGTVKVENTVILERSLAPIRLPGKIAFSGGAAEQPAAVATVA